MYLVKTHVSSLQDSVLVNKYNNVDLELISLQHKINIESKMHSFGKDCKIDFLQRAEVSLPLHDGSFDWTI